MIGVLSTAAYVLLYLLFRGFAGAQAANLAALLLTAVGNTAANRRLTFGVRGRAGAARHQFRGLIAFAAGLVLTSGALAMLHAASPSPGRGTEVLVLVAANLAATLVRFALYRNWVFGSPRGGGTPPETFPPETALPGTALPGTALPEQRCLRPPLSMSSTRPPGARDERHDDPRFRRGAARRRGPVLRQAALARAGCGPGLGPARAVRPAAGHRGCSTCGT